MTNGFKKKEDTPRTANPPISGNAQHKAQAPNSPRPASQLPFFIYITFLKSYTAIIKLKANFKSRSCFYGWIEYWSASGKGRD